MGQAIATIRAETLGGTTLKSSVTGSSLTSVGTLTGGATGTGFTVALSTSTITGVLGATHGGAGSVTGLLKADGAGNVSAAAAGTDYAAAGSYVTSLTGDVTASGPGAAAATLASVGTAGTYGQVTTDAKGRVTSGTTADVTHGGTGLTAVTAHYLPIGNGTLPLTLLAPGTSGLALLSQGASADPAYGVLGVSAGGTGSTTGSAAQTALGASTVGSAFFGLANPSAITFPRINADNSVSALTASAFRTAIGAGSGGGDALTANPLSQFASTTSLQLAGVISDETGSGALVFGTSPTLVTPALGTPSALVGTNITGTASGLTAGNVSTNANLTGDVTSVGNATTLTNAPVIAKVLTGYTSGAGTVSATDSILQAIQKLNGNDGLRALLAGANVFTAAQTINLNSAGAPTPATGTILQAVGADTTVARIEVDAFGAAAFFSARRAGGTGGTPTATPTTTQIGAFNWHGFDGTNWTGPQGSISCLTTQLYTSANQGTKLTLSTTPNNSTTLTVALTLDQDQSATFAGTITSTNLSIASGKVLTVSNSITFAGTDSTTMTFPAASATMAGLGTTQTFTGINTFTPAARSSGVASYLTITMPSDTGMTTATESIGLNLTAGTRAFVDGTIALQRERFFGAPTYNKTTTSATFTDVFNSYFATPVAGTGVTFTRQHAVGIVGATAATSSITGELIVATTLGTGSTSVGIGGGVVACGTSVITPLVKVSGGNAATTLNIVQSTDATTGISLSNSQFVVSAQSDDSLCVSNAGLTIKSTYYFGFSAGGAQGALPDVVLYRGAANFLNLQSARNASTPTSPMCFRIANTITVAPTNNTLTSANGEWFEVNWSATSNVCTLGTQIGVAGGTARNIVVMRGGTTQFTLSALTQTFADAYTLSGGTSTGTKIGAGATEKWSVYGVTPVVQAGSTSDLRTALINFGIVATGGATPLNLNGGALTASSLTFTTSFTASRTAVADTAYAILTTDFAVVYTSLTAARTATLPTAVGVAGKIYHIKDGAGAAGTYNITIATTSSQTIDGSLTKTIATNYGALMVISNGANYEIL